MLSSVSSRDILFILTASVIACGYSLPNLPLPRPLMPCSWEDVSRGLEWQDGKSLKHQPLQPAMMADTCYLGAWELEAGESEVQGHP